MAAPVHTAKMEISTETPIPTARVEGFAEPIRFGLHGGIKKFASSAESVGDCEARCDVSAQDSTPSTLQLRQMFRYRFYRGSKGRRRSCGICGKPGFPRAGHQPGRFHSSNSRLFRPTDSAEDPKFDGQILHWIRLKSRSWVARAKVAPGVTRARATSAVRQYRFADGCLRTQPSAVGPARAFGRPKCIERHDGSVCRGKTASALALSSAKRSYGPRRQMPRRTPTAIAADGALLRSR